MYVLAFDRDWTVDVNPHPQREAVPLEWVQYWAHEAGHEVWAIGNQDLVEEADIPGTVESIRQRDGHVDALGEQDEYGYYEWWPEREERLHILAELFPDAEGYIAVDDLDLGHVDGWEHYHAWDFVEHVRQGELGLSAPPSTDLAPDGGFESGDAVRDVLEEGYVFELTHQTDGEQKTHLVTHFEPDRPSMTPLKGPPAFWFETVGGDEKFSVRIPEISALHSVSYERLADPLAGAAFAAVRKQVEEDPASVDEDTLQTMLSDAPADVANVDRREALRLAMGAVKHRADAREVAVNATFALLGDEPSALDRAALQALHETAADDPTVLKEHVAELAAYASQDSMYQAAATRCLMELAEADPASVLDAVPALEAAATAETEATQSYAVYALSCVAEAYPEEVSPAIDALIEAMQSEDETVQTNALAALGKIASNYPDGAEPPVDELVTVLDADAKRVRNNAVGLLGDLAQEHPAVVIEYADQIAARLEDNNIQARVNASIALHRAGEASPAAIRAQQDRLESALEDSSPEVRANVCSLIGNAYVSVPIDMLEEVKENDLDETVRERAEWAISRLD
ncbi:HEAT repeat domain-containing protein [Halogeometricum borinquense]|uniref:Adaptin n=1 Tax=Halogeometricum borinquense (strain ATCC 700274 / DSM 11551 / JCM 10706 / KCTC 4070 / PR3) TaxID=469382 RepID=E4NSD0_HALBP|nr:adaptin [Halogeometricum borinquense]ADQ66919.1 Adaptin N terminal region protein [Halogeometricum borinquense DSM 11551]ELY30425.1 Adaptin [Halogeometricum borinquense DSM 11551]QIQ76229.1 HEAT repeat domain-containing protein [Halogeometricum borinquense]